MTADRGEIAGAGVAVLFHAALIAALSLSLATVRKEPEPPAMNVELVDEVAMESAAPQQVAVPAQSAPPPEAVEPVEQAAPPPPTPVPTPRAVPQPAPRKTPEVRRPQQRPAPRPAPRAGLGDDFLAELGDDRAPAKPAAPTFSASAKQSIANSIAQQAQRCANREPFIGEGADQVRMTVRLDFARSGRLYRPPRVVGMSGDPDLRAKYGELLEDQVRRIFADCAPFRLPPELYDTDSGGWKETTISYRVRK